MHTLSYLNEKLSAWLAIAPASIWVRLPRDRQFRLAYTVTPSAAVAFGTLLTAPATLPAHEQERYRYEKIEDKHLLRFFFAEEGQALIWLDSPSEAASTLTEDQWELLWLGLKLHLAEEAIASKNAEWSKLLAGIRSISGTLDTEAIIRDIIGNALSVIPAADAGLLHLYDPAIDRLVPKATVGFHDTLFKDFRLKIGESIAGKVFLDGQPRLYRSHPETTQAMRDISADNFHSLNHAKDLQNLNGLLCVPISIAEKRIGVLVLHQFHQDNEFTDYDLALLQGFADQTSVALQNAELYAETKQAYENMATLSAQLQARHDDLIKRNKIHESIKQMSLQNKDAATIVKALSRMTAKPIQFVDWLEEGHEAFAQLPYFNRDELHTLLAGRRHPLFVHLYSAGRADSEYCYLYPLINGSVLLGCLIIPSAKTGLSELARMTIEQGRSVLTLDLVKKQSISSVLYKRAHDLFQEVIGSKGNDLLERARTLGLVPHAHYLVVYAHLSHCHDLALLEANIHRLVNRWKRDFAPAQVLTYGFHNHVTLLLQMNGTEERKALSEQLQTAVEEWERAQEASLSIGVGSMIEGVEHLGKSFEEARKAAHYLAARNRSGVIHYADLGVNRLMLNQSQADIDAFVADVFAPFWAEPQKYQEWEHTLVTYIKCSQSPQQTARELHIHVNTLYQRLKKVEELLEIDLHRPEDLLKVQLACHLRYE
ncbi:helix-turn-helix domain-containing protein [Brevibacillus parabrevis]|uniref:helix-turn-helix domain-containing protein n=1 Tax=Brevibacillus parabrevis TaxID=54914 RepID=UPI001F6010D3|nr:helix-turn-helix domain-containing protein [Brevibacillus parabrevis]